MPSLPTMLPLMKKLAFWLFAALVALLSLLPLDYLPPQTFNIWDKAQHAGGFAALAILGHVAYPARAWRVAAWLLLYGGAIELAQSASGWRQGDLLDLTADAVGIAFGTSALAVFFRTRSAPGRQ